MNGRKEAPAFRARPVLADSFDRLHEEGILVCCQCDQMSVPAKVQISPQQVSRRLKKLMKARRMLNAGVDPGSPRQPTEKGDPGGLRGVGRQRDFAKVQRECSLDSAEGYRIQ